MDKKVLKTTIQVLRGTADDWALAENANLILHDGELAFCKVNDNYHLLKIGDGQRTFADLPWLSCMAADVFPWAKEETKPVYTAAEIQGLNKAIKDAIEDSLFGSSEPSEEKEPIIGLVYAYGSFYDQITHNTGGSLWLYWAQVNNTSPYKVRVQWEANGVTTISDLEPNTNTGHVDVGGNSSPTVNVLQVIRLA